MTDLLLNIPDNFETRAVGSGLSIDAELGTFTGHASAFWAVDDHISAFAPKTFRKSLADKAGRLPMLFMHDPAKLVGPVQDAKEDRTGLAFDAKAIDDGSHGSFTLAHMRGGTSLGLSFGFRTIKERAAADDDPLDLSTLPMGMREFVKPKDVRIKTEVELYELSVLAWTFASQPKATIDSFRSAAEFDAHQATLTTITEAIRAGTVDARTTALIEALIVAWGERAEPDPETDPLTPDRARRDRDIAIVLARSQYSHLLGDSYAH